MKKVRKAVFPVGGLGTRFLPATKSLPKEMLPIANKPLIQHAFEEAMDAGIEEFIFITGRNKNAINNHFDSCFELEQELALREKEWALALTKDWLPKPGNVIFIRQQYPLGLGHAVWCARRVINDEPFAILLADELFIMDSSRGLLSEMVEEFEGSPHANIVATSEVPVDETAKYGIVDPATHEKPNLVNIKGMVEKPQPKDAPSNISIVGRYILQSEIFKYLEELPKGTGGEIQLTDAMRLMLQHHEFYGYKVRGSRLDCGSPAGFFEANVEFALRDEGMRAHALGVIKRISNKIGDR